MYLLRDQAVGQKMGRPPNIFFHHNHKSQYWHIVNLLDGHVEVAME